MFEFTLNWIVHHLIPAMDSLAFILNPTLDFCSGWSHVFLIYHYMISDYGLGLWVGWASLGA
jgi:hypothetical protein